MDLSWSNHMEELIAFTRRSSTYMPYAAAIVDATGKILVQTIAKPEENPIFHAEILAIINCKKQYQGNLHWGNLTLLSTAEPCPMCASACCWVGFGKIVYATDINFAKKLWGEDNPMQHAVSLPAKTLLGLQKNSPKLIAHIEREQAEQLFIDYKQNFMDFLNKNVWNIG